jgi:transcriptional regulator with XRE-family HTH domain
MTALHSQPYKDAIDRVVRRRLALGWSQEELARRLPRYERAAAAGAEPASGGGPGGQLQSFVSKFEQCQRRLDVIEFEHVCHVLGLRVADALDEAAWNGAPPPPVVPLARKESAEERRRQHRRVKPGRKPGKPVRPAKTGSAPGRAWPPRTPYGGAGSSVEDPEREMPEAADDKAPPADAKRRRKPRKRHGSSP